MDLIIWGLLTNPKGLLMLLAVLAVYFVGGSFILYLRERRQR